MTAITKRMCKGCPFNVGDESTEIAYNLGCLPSTYEVVRDCQADGTAWACHSAPKAVCRGYADEQPDRVDLPLASIEGVHFTVQPVAGEQSS